MNVHGDLGYDDNESLKWKQSATSAITDKRLGNLKDGDNCVLQRTTDDLTGGILTSKDKT